MDLVDRQRIVGDQCPQQVVAGGRRIGATQRDLLVDDLVEGPTVGRTLASSAERPRAGQLLEGWRLDEVLGTLQQRTDLVGAGGQPRAEERIEGDAENQGAPGGIQVEFLPRR